MTTSTRRTAIRTLTTAALSCALLTSGAVSGSVAATPSPAAEHEPSGAAGTLGSAESERQLARGLTHESMMLGDAEARYHWTVQVTLPSGEEGVRDSQLASRATAQRLAAELREVGQDATAEAVVADRLADAGGYLGHRVRVGSFVTEAEAAAAKTELGELGYAGGTWYEGWDGGQPDALDGGGPVAVDVLTLDPRTFKGTVTGSFGTDLENTETTSELAEGALAGVNAGFFVYDAAHGAPGDPAGAAAYNGEILSETVGDRPNLVIDHRSGRASIQRLTWEGSISAGRRDLALDGINRVPGTIRNCGGTGDLPTDAPKHDATCTDEDELVVFTEEYGVSTPQGEGLEVVLDRRGKVVDVHRQRGVELGEGQYSVQATGDDVSRLRAFAGAAKRVKLTNQYLDERGKKLRMTPHTQVLNGGPNLLTDGERDITAARDGMVHQDNPGQFYGWTHQRNPRTIAGIDGRGRLVLVTADGRQTDSIGLSVSEAADLAERLGLVDAINLDGGGSTAMVVDGELANSPSGGSERAVGDALVIRGR
ncbi:phosphodiester glycosidase family protein [Microbacterium sp. A93]|uniref:phosphodiester glycosidase family protein n=1 Tax=Microbacterium sp. A93 TaxID=3450716 RepID=UPI003F427410